MERIGVIGLGRMGSAIAQRLAAQGHSVLGWTRSGRDVDGINSVGELADLVERSDVLVLSLLNDAAVAEMLDTLLDLDLGGRLIIDTRIRARPVRTFCATAPIRSRPRARAPSMRPYLAGPNWCWLAPVGCS